MSLQAQLMTDLLTMIHANSPFLTAEATRAQLKRAAIIATQPVTAPRLKAQVSVDTVAGHQVFCVETPTSRHRRAAIIYLHGGAWFGQIAPRHWHFIDRLVRATNITCMVPIYPLAPAAHFMTSFELLAQLELDLRAGGYTDLAVVGDSAGGNLALAFSEWTDTQPDLSRPEHVALLSPILDITLQNPEIPALAARDPLLAVPGLRVAATAWAGSLNTLRDYRVSPLNGDLAALPPTLIIGGSAELPAADNRLLATNAISAQAPVTYLEFADMVHDFALLPLPEAKQALALVTRFLGDLPFDLAAVPLSHPQLAGAGRR